MIYELMLQKVIFPLANALTGRKFWKRYLELQKSQWLPRHELEKMQLERLKTMVKHAYETTRLYKQLMKKAGVKPEDILSLDDIKKLPIVRKNDFRRGFPDLCTSNSVPRNQWLYDSTSGSTGSPFQFIRDQNFSDYSLANTYRNYTWTGMKLGNKIALLWGAHKSSGAIKILDALLRRKMYSSFDVEIQYVQYYDNLRRYKPYLLEAYSASITHFARLLEKDGLKQLKVPAVISSAETLYPKNRKLIEKMLRTKVYNRYGSREAGNIAHECEKHNGLHINSESYIVEVVDSDKTGKGRLIVTNLTNFAMPFIRYDTEDYAVAGKPDRTCPCGRGLPLLASVEGRITDFIVMPNGEDLSYLFFNYYFEQYGAYLRQFQVVQDKKNHLFLKLVVTEKYTANKEKELLDGIIKKVGSEMKITIQKVSKIEPEKSGKFRPVKRLI